MSERFTPAELKKLRAIEWKLGLEETMGEQLQTEYQLEDFDRRGLKGDEE